MLCLPFRQPLYGCKNSFNSTQLDKLVFTFYCYVLFMDQKLISLKKMFPSAEVGTVFAFSLRTLVFSNIRWNTDVLLIFMKERFMKKKWIFGLLAVMLVFGMTLGGCGNGSTSDGGVGTNPTQSLDGVWEQTNGNFVITINGNRGVFTEINSGGWRDVQNRGNVRIGDQYFRSISRTGDLVWSCQSLHYNSAFATSWNDVTLVMSADARTLMSHSSTAGNPTVIFTRKTTPTLNGVWEQTDGNFVITINGSNGVFTQINSGSWKEVQNRGNIKIGDQYFRNISRTGDFTWSGQAQNYSSTFTLSGWLNVILTMDADGRTLRSRFPTAGNRTVTFTRRL
jgi:roadblock/LC7 domain-containing protein